MLSAKGEKVTLKQDIMNLIAEQLDDMFGTYYDGKCIVVTFSGEIVSIEDDMLSALKKLQGKKRDQPDFIFLHEVNGERH